MYDGEITNLHEEEDESNFMRKDWKWEYWEEVVDAEEIQGPPETYIIISHIYSNLLYQTDSTLSSSAYLNVLQQFFSKTCFSDQ